MLVGVGFAGALFALFMRLAVGVFRSLFSRPTGEQEALQAAINVRASEQPVGPGAGIGRRRGFNWVLWFVVGCILAYLLIFSAHGEVILEFIRNRVS